MIILKIKQKGMYIEIPGITPFRTPAEVNITHVSIPLVASKLQAQGILNFEIVSDTKGKEKKLTQKDFIKEKKIKKNNQEDRINVLESLVEQLIQKIPRSNNNSEEQINKKLDSIEKLILNNTIKKDKLKVDITKSRKEPVIDDEIFIPSVNIEEMDLKGEASKSSIKQDNTNLESIADMLSNIGK